MAAYFLGTLLVFAVPLFIIFPPIPVEHSDALSQTHSKAGVSRPSSRSRRTGNGGSGGSSRNVSSSDEHGEGTDNTASIHSLWVFPIKSCRGIELSRSRVFKSGLEFDRLFTLAQLRSPFPLSTAADPSQQPGAEERADNHKWHFITQRRFPLMATVNIDLWLPDPDKKSRQLGVPRPEDAFIVLRFPWRDPGLAGAVQWVAAKLSRGWSAMPEKEILLPTAFPTGSQISQRGYQHEDVTVWGDTVFALNMEKDLPRELGLYLGVSNRLALFRMDPAIRRKVYRNVPRDDAAGYQPVIDFHDDYPISLMNLNSVKELESKIPLDNTLADLDFRRFRSNIYISDLPPYDEETWKFAKLKKKNAGKRGASGPAFFVSGRSTRCRLPNVDPDTGLTHKTQPDKALREHRRVDKGAPKSGCLGMQLFPKFADETKLGSMEFWIETGMKFEVTERGEHVHN